MSLDFGTRDAAARSEEAARLVKTAGADVAEVVTGKRARPDAATFAGSGKVEQIRDALRLHNAQTVVFDQALSAAQVRNLERVLAEGWKPVRVYDRTELILEIFAQRARSHEGKLQVELAQLQHHATRLVRGWTHLERQRGALDKTGGPGEKQIELDRRLIGERVKKLKERIRKVTRTRETQRAGRNRSGLLRVSLVGYTNAGSRRCSTAWRNPTPTSPTSSSPRWTRPPGASGLQTARPPPSPIRWASSRTSRTRSWRRFAPRSRRRSRPMSCCTWSTAPIRCTCSASIP